MQLGASIWPFQWVPPYDDGIRRLARLGFKHTELIAWNRQTLDEYYTPQLAGELQATLRGLGKDATLNIHEGADHAFFNDSRPEVYSAEHALEAWERTLTLFRDELANTD